MKKVMTAMGNIELINLLKKEKDIKILNKDILYREAIIDILEREKNIDIILINELLPGEINLIELVFKIKDINKDVQIIICLEKENKILEKNLIANGADKIYYNNKIRLEDFIKIIKNEEIVYEKENGKIKNMLIEKKNRVYFFKKNRGKNTNLKDEKGIHNAIMKTKIINFLGIPGSGKTVISLVLVKYLMENNYKILLIDADINKKDISTILGIKIRKTDKKKIKLLQNIINKKYIVNKKAFLENYLKKQFKKINNNLYVFYKLEKLFYVLEKEDELLKDFIYFIKKYFNFVIIDMGCDNKKEINKKIIENSNFNLILLEPNLLGIKSTKILLEKINNLNDNFYFIINKENNFSIDFNILKNCFCDFKFLGKIKLNNYYNNFINSNFMNKKIINEKYLKNDIKNIYIKLVNKL